MPPLRTALVTGAGGFCATHLATYLAGEAQCAVVGLGRRPEPLHGAGLTDYLACDVVDSAGLARAVRTVRPDWVFHLAGTSQGGRRTLFATNARGTTNLLKAILREHPTAATVVLGTAAEYGSVPRRRLPITEEQPCRPRTAYGASKYAATQAAQRFHRVHRLRVVIARPFNIIGPLMPQSLVLGAVLSQIRGEIEANRRPAVVSVGRTDPQRDFVPVEEVVTALVRMVQGSHWGEIFNLCSGTPTPIRSLLDLVARAVDWPVRFTRHPARARAPAPLVIYGSYAKAANAFGFAPTQNLEEAVRRLCRLELGAPPAIP